VVGHDVAVDEPGEEQRSAASTPGGWIAPESGGPSAFDIVAFLPAEAGAAPTRSPDGTATAAVAAAGVAVANGDARWPEAADGTELGDRNPLADVEPVGAGGVLDGGFDLLRVGFGRLVGLAAGLLLPLQLVELIVATRSGLADQVSIEQSPLAGMAMLGGSSSSFGWVFAALRVLVLSFLGLTVGIMVQELLGDRLLSGRRLAARAGRRWWVAAVVPLLTVPVRSVGFCLVYVGWFLLDALLMCTSVVAGAEGLGPLRAFGRSWSLARSSYGTALAVSFGGFVVTSILQLALLLGPTFLVGMFTVSESVLVLVQQVASLVLLVTQPLTACIAARAYVELRCRSEALDLERRRVAQGLVAAGDVPAVPSALVHGSRP
jgi:hypothetical protein